MVRGVAAELTNVICCKCLHVYNGHQAIELQQNCKCPLPSFSMSNVWNFNIWKDHYNVWTENLIFLHKYALLTKQLMRLNYASVLDVRCMVNFRKFIISFSIKQLGYFTRCTTKYFDLHVIPTTHKVCSWDQCFDRMGLPSVMI